MDKKIKINKKAVDPISAENKKWQEHVFTSAGRQILAEVLNGEIKQEIPSAYIGYFPQLESMDINQYPQFISGVTELPEINKKIDILSKEVQEDKTVLTVQVSNIGLEQAINYNTLIIMAYNKSRQIVPFTISAIKETQVLQTQDIPFQQLFEITMLISSEAEITIELQPIVDAGRIEFDKGNTGLQAENVQDAIEEVVVKINQNKNAITELTGNLEEQTQALNTHKGESILTGVHDLQYDKSQNKFKYKESGQWNDIDTGAGVSNELNQHKGVNITNADGIHGIKYDEISTKLQYKKDGEWKDIETGQKAEQELNTHKGKKISNSGGVHGLEYLEEDGSLQIEKQNGQKVKFESGMNPDDLFNELNSEILEGIQKIGENYEQNKNRII